MLAPTLGSLSIWEAHSQSETLFNPEQLIRMGNAFSILDVKHDSRFVDIFQDQLSWACPLLTASQCEMVHPTLALGPLVNDGTRRLFLEQCAKVGAGRPIPHSGSDKKAREVTPDVKSFQAESSRRRSRLKHISNIYIIEAFVRKEHLEFFSSLPANVKAYLDALHEDACHLAVKPPSKLASQVADALRKDCCTVLCRRELLGECGEAARVGEDDGARAAVDDGLPLVQSALQVGLLQHPRQERESAINRARGEPGHLTGR